MFDVRCSMLWFGRRRTMYFAITILTRGMKGLFITFEGNEGSGKSTQLSLVAQRLVSLHYRVRALREPGGTPIGEEIRHTLMHSQHNNAMTPETELLLMNASRAQLVRELIRPALEAGEIVLCDRFYDSTIAYQGYGRQLDLKVVKGTIAVAVGDTRPDLTLLLLVNNAMSEQRRRERQSRHPAVRDRMEEADRSFFERVNSGYVAIAAAEPDRVRRIDAGGDIKTVSAAIWPHVQSILPPAP
jgi:dTMP kinase